MLQLRCIARTDRVCLADRVPRQPVLANCYIKHRQVPSRPRISLPYCAAGGMGELATQQQLIKLQQQLLDSIANRDWDTYEDLCDESLTAFEPEAGTLILLICLSLPSRGCDFLIGCFPQQSLSIGTYSWQRAMHAAIRATYSLS